MSERQDKPYNQENAADKFSRIGIHCHEFAHTIGIGHASGSRADLMEAGTRNGPDNRGAAPAPLNPAHRALKGWITPTVITGQQQFDVYYSLTAPQVFRINSNYNNDYFLFENRRFNQTMVIGSTTVPDYNNAAFYPPAWSHGSITEGIFAWRIINGSTSGYNTNGLIYASGNYGATCPEGTPSETDDGVPFPGNCNVRVLSPWSDSRNPYSSESGHYTIYVPNTKNGTNVGMEVVSENSVAGYFTLKLYQSAPENLSPSKPKSLTAIAVTSGSSTLTWTANTEPDISGYNIYRGVVYAGSAEPTYTKINMSLVTPTSYTDNNYESITGLPQNIDLYHRYRITAVDNQGKESVKSEYVDAYFTHITSGARSTNRTYQIDVNVIGDVTYQSGTILTITSGTKVKFAAGKKLTILGSLSANGTTSNHITFTSASPAPVGGDWYAIKLYGGVNSLKYCNINYATFGVIVNSTTGTTIENCNISSCSSYGVHAYNALGIGALRLKGTWLESNSAGLGIVNAWVSIEPSAERNTEIYSNEMQGIYVNTGQLFMNHATVSTNGSNGIQVNGSGSQVYLSANGIQPGWNIIRDNSEQIVSLNGGNVYIGKRTEVCNCEEELSALQSINKPGCPPECYWDWEDSWGYNTIYGTDHWVDNWTSNPIYAHLTYWGEEHPTCPVQAPSSSHFYGTVYTNYPQCYSSAMLSSSGGVIDPPEIDSVRLYRIIKYLKRYITEEPDSADHVLPILLPLVGPGGKFNYALDVPWEIFLSQVSEITPSASIKNQAIVYRIMSRMFEQDYDGVISLANNTLANKPNNDLWLYCQSQNISAYCQMDHLSSAEQVYASMKSKGMRLDPQGMTDLRRMIDMSNGVRRLVHPSGDNRNISSASSIPQEYGLSSNYPNPFNPVTTIKYTLPENVKVSLKVYNVLGQEVKTLVDEFQSAGIKSVSLNSGELPSGVYFYRLQTNKFTDVKKMLITK